MASRPKTTPCPRQLIEADGTPLFGVYAGTPDSVDLERLAGSLTLRFRQKRWQYIAVLDQRVIAAAAIADLGYLGVAFVTVWDRVERRWVELQDKLPLRFGVVATGTPGFGEHSWSGLRGQISMTTDRSGRSLRARMHGQGHQIELDLLVPPAPDGYQPLTVVAPAGPGPNVTHKAAALPVRGRISVDGRELKVDPESALAVVDWTRGFPPYRTSWNWSIGSGRAVSGEVTGFNLCAGFNDAIDTENAVWVDGKLYRTPPVRFELPAGGARPAWRIASEDRSVDLTFHPEAERAASENYLLLSSSYRQPVGLYRGRFTLPGGPTLELEDLPGVAEDHRARW